MAWQIRRLRRHELLPGHPGFYIYRTVEPPGGAGSAGVPPLSLVVLGDSTAAGVGVRAPEESLPSRLAERIAADHSRAVRVLSYGWAGARVDDLVRDQLVRAQRPLRPEVAGSRPPLPDADIVAVSIGSNDVIHGTSPTRFRRAMRDVLGTLRAAAPAAEVVIAGIPRFRGVLPQYEPLITIGDLFGGVLRRIQRREAAAAGVAYADLARDVIGQLDPATASLAADAFHPGPEIYRAWAAVIAEALAARRARDASR